MVDEICARDFPVLSRLTTKSKDKFVDLMYEDVMSGDSPEKISEDKIFEHVQTVIALAISIYLDDCVDTL
jgi:hypothetical protein